MRILIFGIKGYIAQEAGICSCLVFRTVEEDFRSIFSNKGAHDQAEINIYFM